MAAIRKDAKPKVCTKAQFETVLMAVASGESTTNALLALKMEMGRFYALLAVSPEAALAYARAKSLGLERKADEAEFIADTEPERVETKFGSQVDPGWVAWQKLRVETRKWMLAKLAPKRWGDKVQQEVSGPDGGAIVTRQEGPNLNELRTLLRLPDAGGSG